MFNCRFCRQASLFLPYFDTSIAQVDTEGLLQRHSRQGRALFTTYPSFAQELETEKLVLEETPDFSYAIGDEPGGGPRIDQLIMPAYRFDPRHKMGKELVDLSFDNFMPAEDREICKPYEAKRFVIHTLFIAFGKLGLTLDMGCSTVHRILTTNIPNGRPSDRLFSFSQETVDRDEKQFITAVNRKADFQSAWCEVLERNILTRHAVWLLARALINHRVGPYYSHPDLVANIGGLCQTLDLLVRKALNEANQEDKQQAYQDWSKEVNTWEKHRHAMNLSGYKAPNNSLDGTSSSFGGLIRTNCTKERVSQDTSVLVKKQLPLRGIADLNTSTLSTTATPPTLSEPSSLSQSPLSQRASHLSRVSTFPHLPFFASLVHLVNMNSNNSSHQQGGGNLFNPYASNFGQQSNPYQPYPGNSSQAYQHVVPQK